MKKLSITTRITLSFVMVIIIFVGLSIYLIQSMIGIKDNLVKMYEHPFTVSNEIKEVKLGIVKIHREMKDISTVTNQETIDELVENVNQYEAEVLATIDVIYDRFLGEKTMLDNAKNSFIEWKVIRDEVIELTRNGNLENASRITKEKGAEHVGKIIDYVNELDVFASKKAIEFFEISQASSDKSTLIGIVAIVISSSLAIIMSFLLIIIIKRGLKEINDRMLDLVEGEADLTKRIQIDSKNELGQLASKVNLFLIKTQNLVISIKLNVEQLSNASSEIKDVMVTSNQSMGELASSFVAVAENTQNSASLTEESNAGIEEIASNSEVISDQSQETVDNINKVLDSATYGAKRIASVLEASKQVEKSSKEAYSVIRNLVESVGKIGDIINIINGISDQTNLLALNAAIEAARAGEAGKGFAVVAEEIRKLAEESIHSTNEISNLLEMIQQNTSSADESVRNSEELSIENLNLANEVSKQFKDILVSIEEVSSKVVTISNSSKIQTNISNEMSTAIEELARDSQSNASVVEEVNAVIEEQVSSFEVINSKMENLDYTAQELKNEADKFKV
ncbi:methyl-accepting chemotaxis protein [Vallitalea sp.]|jgi:methyl-accepting chemotaxis protein|uniref:methyl-accepting chemotaxis protein n=1 Tax=Vallitalea sp. TaxID=1882829 RepID=UPI0025DEDD72|nr:methyl-accepting chemotaxis protein [Vallitalea sp.]MCT4686710.1 methyl-accepting chemotaxis protein [Vallitalea sp.]